MISRWGPELDELAEDLSEISKQKILFKQISILLTAVLLAKTTFRPWLYLRQRRG